MPECNVFSVFAEYTDYTGQDWASLQISDLFSNVYRLAHASKSFYMCSFVL